MSIHLATNRTRSLSTFGLVMINVIAVDSLRTLPFSAKYGFSLISFYLIAAFCFFFPIAIISAELATTWPNTGGLYVWIKEAFGRRWGFFVIWLQWIYNVVWYPTILSFVAATIMYLIDPALTEHRLLMLSVVLSLFWITTLVNCFGMRISGLVSTLGTILGTLLPMLFIIGLAVVWLGSGHPAQIDMSWQTFLPDFADMENLAFFITIVFGLIGIEMSAAHAEEVKNPARDFPKALLISATIILCSLMLSSLAIAIVVPQQELGLATGLIQAYDVFFTAFNMQWMEPIIAGLIVLGALACVSAWVIGPTKGLWAASADGSIPPMLQRLNKHHVPIPILLLQGIIFTLLCSVFLLMPTVNSTYWILSALTAQLALIVYIAFFAAAIVLRNRSAAQPRAFKVPGGKWGIRVLAGMGMVTCVAGIAIGFIPPADVRVDNLWLYEGLLLGGIILFSVPPLIMDALAKPEWIAN